MKQSKVEKSRLSDSFKTSLSSSSLMDQSMEKTKAEGFGDVLKRVLTRRTSMFEENREEVGVSWMAVAV